MQELISTFGVDWKIILAQIVNFGVLFFVLKRFAYGPVLSMLQKRKEIVVKSLEDADKAEKSLRDATTNAENISKEAKNTANALVTDAQSEANQYITRAKYDALDEKSKIISSAKDEIQSLKTKNEILVKEKAVEHIISTVRSILTDEVNEEMNKRIVSRLTKA